jgi:hypothetical protein
MFFFSQGLKMATQNLSANELRDYAKFNGINFPQWRYGVMLKLRRKKLEKLVLGQDPKPAEVITLTKHFVPLVKEFLEEHDGLLFKV